MTRLLFLHSAGQQGDTEGSGPFLAKLRSTLEPEIRISAPLMPHPDAPDPALWGPVVAEAINGVEGDFVALGHSLGGSVLLNHLAANPAPAGLRGVVIVAAPFWGLAGWEYDGFRLPQGFAEKLGRLPNLSLYYTRDDAVAGVTHGETYAANLPNAKLSIVDGRGHAFASGPVDDIVATIRSFAGEGDHRAGASGAS